MKRGRKPKYFETKWTRQFAYAVGLIASDGNISPDMRHVNLTSKDKEIIDLFKKALSVENRIGKKARSHTQAKKYYVLQVGSVVLVDFLLSIGMTPAKSKTMKSLKIPEEFFFDFLRGCIDGDGNLNEFMHKESARAQLKIRLTSASIPFLTWVLSMIRRMTYTHGGWISRVPYKSTFTLSFGKKDGIILLKRLYIPNTPYRLGRKYDIAKKYLGE